MFFLVGLSKYDNVFLRKCGIWCVGAYLRKEGVRGKENVSYYFHCEHAVFSKEY